MWHVIGTSVLFFDLALVRYPASNIFRHIAMEHRSANEAASTLACRQMRRAESCKRWVNQRLNFVLAIYVRPLLKTEQRCVHDGWSLLQNIYIARQFAWGPGEYKIHVNLAQMCMGVCAVYSTTELTWET